MNDFQLGKHEAAIASLQADMDIVKSDTRSILLLLAERKGERKTMVKLGAAVGAVAGSAVTIAGKILLVKLGLHA